MKSVVTKMLAVLMVGALTGVVALAKVKKERVTFDNDIKVNGTLVKKGSYDVKFDDETNQLSIIKNGKVVVEATARLEPRSNKANDFQIRSVTTNNELQLAGVTFGGSDKDVMIANGGASTSGNN
jgi:type II secretory pathway component PulC